MITKKEVEEIYDILTNEIMEGRFYNDDESSLYYAFDAETGIMSIDSDIQSLERTKELKVELAYHELKTKRLKYELSHQPTLKEVSDARKEKIILDKLWKRIYKFYKESIDE